MITVNHLYTGTIDGVTFSIDENRNETYSESKNTCSYHKTYHLQSEQEINISIARNRFVYWIKLANRLTLHGYPITSFNISHGEEEDLDHFYTIELDYGGEAEDLNYEEYKIPYHLQESFETGGGTAHISTAWATSASDIGETVYQVDADAPSTFNGQIGWNGETAEGVDVIRPAFCFTLHKKVAAEDMTTAYRQTLCLLTGSVNDGAFCGFSAGNLLLESVSGSSSAEYKEEDVTTDPVSGEIVWPPRITYDLAFKFRGGIEFTNFYSGGIQIASKKAHQYLWTYTERQDDSTAGVTLEYPRAVIVNDVYPPGDFTLLNIYGEQDNQ